MTDLVRKVVRNLLENVSNMFENVQIMFENFFNYVQKLFTK